MLEYTREELERFACNDRIWELYRAAREADDREEEKRLFKQILLPAESCLLLKCTRGAEELRTGGYILTEAEKLFGPDWLERDDDELIAILHRR